MIMKNYKGTSDFSNILFAGLDLPKFGISRDRAADVLSAFALANCKYSLYLRVVLSSIPGLRTLPLKLNAFLEAVV